MQAIVLTPDGVTFRTDYPAPVPRPDEVRVQVLCAGICETDLQLMQGYMGFEGVLGHEFVGMAADGTLRGQRVVGEINCACHGCEVCAAGRSTHCPHRSVLGILGHDGAFADVIAVPERNLHLVPDDLPTERAVFTEPLAAAFQMALQAGPWEGRRVTVLGDGRLGNLCAQVLRLHGANVRVVGRHPHKLELLARLGIDTVLAADVVIECTGRPEGLATAIRLVRPQGIIVLKTTVAGEQTLALAPFVIHEITLIGSRCGPFPPALAALRAGEVHVDDLIEARRPLAEGVHALHDVRSRSLLKTLLIP